MGFKQLIVNFWGICTFMKRDQSGVPESAAWGNRYVLVNASNPATISDNPNLSPWGISPHIAELQIAVDDLITMTDTETTGFTVAATPITIPEPPPAPFFAWQLDSVILSVANARPLSSTEIIPVEPPFPSLRTFVLDQVMPPPSESMTLHTVPNQAAAYFDFFQGQLFPQQTGGGAIIGHLVVETLGNPQIRVRSFTNETAVVNIELRDGAEVVVGNGPAPGDPDSDEDFRLHYLTASVFPDVVSVPTVALYPPGTFPPVKTYNPARWDKGFMTTPGCSNSTYP